MAGADGPQGWIQELCEEMNRSIENRPSQSSWELMKSATVPEWRFYPILNHVRLQPDGSFEFDVYLYRVPEALPAIDEPGKAKRSRRRAMVPSKPPEKP